jgi:hypothetical protein
MEKQLVGIEVTDKTLKLEGQDLIGVLNAQHVGKVGSLKLTVEGKFELLPFVNTAIDKLEELIPGDQKMIAGLLKSAVAQIKITL